MKLITYDLIEELTAKAGLNARKRVNHNVHESPSDSVQRLFVAARPGSYFRPHRHPDKWEFAMVVRGRFDVLVFNDGGCVMDRRTVGPGADVAGFEMPANTWHSWIPLADDSVFFEVKKGPYDPKKAAEFALWAPEEGSPDAAGFAARLGKAGIGDMMA